MTASPAAIILWGVTQQYGQHQVLGPLDLIVPDGQRLAVVGPSGCGKSTLLRLLLGLVAPSAGTVQLGGTIVGPHTARALRLRVGYVIQDGGLFPHLCAADNCTLMARRLGRSPSHIAERLLELASLVELEQAALRRFPTELSGGQKQRVALMRALFLDPSLLLLDEPLGALDPLVRFAIRRDLNRIFVRQQKTVVIVTHDMGEAAVLAEEILLLRGGAIVQKGSPAELRTRPNAIFVSDFFNHDDVPS